MSQTSNTSKTNEEVMSLTGHFKELKNRILVCLVVLITAFLFIFQYASTVVDYLTALGTAANYHFVYLSPQELFMQYIKISGIGALVATSPVILYEIWAFMRPALTKSENFTMFFAMVAGLGFFALGVAFAYMIALPFMLFFFTNINTTAVVSSSISIAEYISFLISIFLMFGIVFELPVVTVILTQLGLLKPEWMISGRPFAIVIIFIVGAFITPPDAVSQCMIAIPMVMLYQISIYLCKFFTKRKKKKEELDD